MPFCKMIAEWHNILLEISHFSGNANYCINYLNTLFFFLKGKSMNSIYQTPLLTAWPIPISGREFSGLFDLKEKIFRHKEKIKNKLRKFSPFSHLLTVL